MKGSDSVSKFEDKHGNIWVVRECEHEEDCVVVESWYPKPIIRNAGIKNELESMGMSANAAAVVADGIRERDATEEDGAPRVGFRKLNDFHIPLHSLGDLIEALRQYDREQGAPHA